MPPRKGKRGPKKGGKADVVPESKPEQLEEVKEEEMVSQSPPAVDMEVEEQGDLEKSEPKEEEVKEVNKELEQLNDKELEQEEKKELEEVNMDQVNVDLDFEDTTGLLKDNEEMSYREEERQITNEELNKDLEELLESLMKLSKELELKEEEEEEEGAIKEEEVPFERMPEVNRPCKSLLIVNLPPEMEPKKVVEVFMRNPKLVRNACTVSKTQTKVFFTSVKVAMEAKSKLDQLKLYNRRIQAMYAKEYHPRQMMSYGMHRGNHYNMTNVPPPPSSTHMGPQTERTRIMFNKYKLVNARLQEILLQIYKKVNLEKGSETLKWDESKTLYENQVKFEKVYEKVGMSTRYVLVGNLGNEFLEESSNIHEFLSRYSNTTYNFQVVKMPWKYGETSEMEEDKEEGGAENERKWLYVVFEKNRDGYNFYNQLNNAINFSKNQVKKVNGERGEDEWLKGLVIKFCCPLVALETLWVGNISEFCGYFANEDELYNFFKSLGIMKNFKLVYESNCIFVTYQNKDIAAKVYNFLNTMSPKKVIRVYQQEKEKTQNEEMEMELEEIFEAEKEDDLLNVDFSISKSDNSLVLGQKLLNAIKRRKDSQELIERILNIKEEESLMKEEQLLMERRNRGYRREYQEYRREKMRYDRRQYREGYQRDYREEYSREMYSREGYGRELYRERERERDRELYSRDKEREYNRFRMRHPINKEVRVDRFGRTIREYDRSRKEEPWKQGKYTQQTEKVKEVEKGLQKEINKEIMENEQLNFNPPPPTMEYEVSKEMEIEMELEEDQDKEKIEYCQLLKRGKLICKVKCKFMEGDITCRIPELLDVNQRANPERLKNCLSKSRELSLWQLGPDSREDKSKYESLCDYLISKNRVALVQQGPFDVYIVPPHQQFLEMFHTPDVSYMYAYILPRAP